MESNPYRSDFDREIGITKVYSVLDGENGDDTLLSRGGYDFLHGDYGIDHYIIEPTHEVEDHHFEEGCAIIYDLEEDEVITFRTED